MQLNMLTSLNKIFKKIENQNNNANDLRETINFIMERNS